MKIKALIPIAIIGFVLAFAYHFIAIAAIDAPHNEASNNVECGSCHGEGLLYSPFWGYDYTPAHIDDTPYNKICWSCHTAPSSGEDGYTGDYAPLAQPHSSRTTESSKYGEWSRECIDCHNPHYQNLKFYKKTDADNLYLASGEIIHCEDNGDGTSTLTYSTITYKTETGWDAADLTKKTIENRRAILFPDLEKFGYNYEIKEVNDSPTSTIIVFGDACDFLPLRSNFAVVYGQFIRRDIMGKICRIATDQKCNDNSDCKVCSITTDQKCNDQSDCPVDEECKLPDGEQCILKVEVKFFDKTGQNSFAFDESFDDPYDPEPNRDETPYGVCQVCHTDEANPDNPTHWRADGTGTDHHNNNVYEEGCIHCHSHVRGFVHGGPGSLECFDCHEIGSHLAHGVETIGCDPCHTDPDPDDEITGYPPHVGPGTGFSFTYEEFEENTCSNIKSTPSIGSCHFDTDATWDESACTGCHSSTHDVGNRVNVMEQFSDNSHHIQGTTVEGAHCYECHWEADGNGLVTTHHENNPSGSPVDLVVYGDGTRPTDYEPGTAIQHTAVQYTEYRRRREIEKLNTHCLSCHSDQNNETKPFGETEGKTPRQYAWDNTSINARYSQTETTTWGKYTDVEKAAKKDITKAYSAHGKATLNEGGWNPTDGVDGTITNNRNGAEIVACFDCHNSHGSSADGVTTSYESTSATHTKGGILKDAEAGKGGSSVTYKPQAGGSSDPGYRNAYNAGAGLCFDCHLNELANTTPWGYSSTFGASEPIMGYWDTPYFGPGDFASQQRFTYKKRHPHQGGHFGASDTLSSPPPTNTFLIMHMDEELWNGTPGEVKDSSPSSNNGTAYNNANTIDSGKFGRAGSFNGSDSYVDLTMSSLNDVSNWTFSAWVYPLSSTTSTIYSEGNPGFTFYVAYWEDGSVHVATWHLFRTGNWMSYATPAGVISTDTWNFIAVVLENGDINTGNVTVYVNGDSYSGTLGKEYNSTTQYATIGLNVGSTHGGTQSSYPFYGYIDEVVIYKTALTESVIQALYQQSAPAPLQTPIIGGLCTPCHDPHGASPTIDSPDTPTINEQEYAVPLLKGTWLTSLYKEDTTPVNNWPGTIRTDRGAEGIPYHIDQNTFGSDIADDAITGITETASEYAGLCLKCHHLANDLLNCGLGGWDCNWKGKAKIHQSIKGGGGYGWHKYPCSKCHTPHNSRLPRLMVTNCLDNKHKGFMGNNTVPKLDGLGWPTLAGPPPAHYIVCQGLGTILGLCHEGDVKPYWDYFYKWQGSGGGHMPGSWGGTEYDLPGLSLHVTCHENQTGDNKDHSWNNKTEWAEEYTPEEILSGPFADQFLIFAWVTVTWTTRNSSTSYVDYGLTTDYDSIMSDDTSVTSHSIILTGLINHSTYHYKVRSSYDGGVTWAESDDNTFYFSVPPTAPWCNYVPLKTCTEPCPTTLEWTPSTDPDNGPIEYYVEVDNNADFSSPEYISDWVSGTSWTFTLDPTCNPTYTWYWHVKARDGNHPEAVSSSFSSSFVVITAYPPPAPELIDEPNTTESVPTDIPLEWYPVTSPHGHPVEYQVLMSMYPPPPFISTGGSGWLSEDANCSEITGKCSWTVTLDTGGTWWWKVQARDKDVPLAESPWSTIDSFLAYRLLTAPELIEEPDIASTVPVPVTLDWMPTTSPLGNPMQYYVEVSDDASDFSTPDYNTPDWIFGTSWTETLDPGYTWYWRVRARDSVYPGLLSSWSEVSYFGVNINIIDDSFEGIGYEESWTDAEGSGCSLDPDSAIPGTAPLGAGSECLKSISDTPSYYTYIMQDYGSEQPKTSTNMYFYIESEGMDSDDYINLIVLQNSAGNDVIIFRLQQFGAGFLNFNLRIVNDGIWNDNIYGFVQLNTWYRIEIKYDDINDTWEWRVNKTTQDSGNLEGAHYTGIQKWFFGQSSLTPESAGTIYFDQVTVNTNNN